MTTTIPVPVIGRVIGDVMDRKRMSAGITACSERKQDFSSALEMQLAGIAMVPEARKLMSDTLSKYWDERKFGNVSIAVSGGEPREIVIGAGFHAAVYCANRVAMGFPKPIVLEKQESGENVGGAFAMSLNPVFRLNSRNRPGTAGLPDQDKALNYLPGGLIQPSMLTSEEYPDNADMAWLIRLALAQFADVRTGACVSGISAAPAPAPVRTTQLTVNGEQFLVGRVLDARGTGMTADACSPETTILTFPQLMRRMGNMFPLRGMHQAAVIGGGDSGRCAVESLLGLAPGNTSAIGLDYVNRVDWYVSSLQPARTCSEFRADQRGRYVRIAQYLEGNESNPSTRLRIFNQRAVAVQLPGGALVGDRTYDMAVECTGGRLDELSDSFTYSRVGVSTVLATRAAPYESYRIGPAADIRFSEAEQVAKITDIPANKVAMFRLAPRTAALAAILSAPGGEA